jgi:hypothetical protein
MLVDSFGDKLVHSSYTGDAQAVGKLVHTETGDKRLS